MGSMKEIAWEREDVYSKRRVQVERKPVTRKGGVDLSKQSFLNKYCMKNKLS